MTMATKTRRTVPIEPEDGQPVCDAPILHGGTVRWRINVLGSDGLQVLYHLYACDAHRRTVEREARERDD